MDNKRIAVAAIVIDEPEAVPSVNEILHEYSGLIIGRMGIPYQPKAVRIISVVLDAPVDTINALTGKIGKIEGVNAKTVYSNV